MTTSGRPHEARFLSILSIFTLIQDKSHYSNDYLLLGGVGRKGNWGRSSHQGWQSDGMLVEGVLNEGCIAGGI